MYNSTNQIFKNKLMNVTICLETRVGSNCKTDEDCRAVKNAICGPTGTCRCDRAHFASKTETECIPGNINTYTTFCW